MSWDEEVATLSSVTEREESRVPRVDVSASVFRPCGRAALGSVIVVVPCVVLLSRQFFWIDSRKLCAERALSLSILILAGRITASTLNEDSSDER